MVIILTATGRVRKIQPSIWSPNTCRSTRSNENNPDVTTKGKDRVAISGKGGDDLEKLQAPVAGVDVKMIQGILQDTLGVKKEHITGEITFRKEGDEPVYNVRLRRLPGNHVLLDISAKGDPDAVLKQTAMAMIEVFDPHIAASIYYRNRDEANALRMINVVLSNDNPADDKYSLNLRAYIHITAKRFDAAQADYERIMKIDPKFAPAHGMAAWLLRAQGKLDASLAEADKAIELAPGKYFGYVQKAQTLPVLVVHHAQDACILCRPYEVPLILKGLTNSPIKKLVMVDGGESPSGDPCEAMHFHGFVGKEQEVVGIITNWIKQPSN